MHPLFFSIYFRFHRRCAALWKQRWLQGEMPAVYWGNVAEWEHDDGETALYSWRMGTRVILPLHHFRGHRVSHPVRCTGVADLFLPLQRPRRVGNPSLHIKISQSVNDVIIHVYFMSLHLLQLSFPCLLESAPVLVGGICGVCGLYHLQCWLQCMVWCCHWKRSHAQQVNCFKPI